MLNFGLFSHLTDVQFSWLPLETPAVRSAANVIAKGSTLTTLLLKLDGEQHVEPAQLINFFQDALVASPMVLQPLRVVL